MIATIPFLEKRFETFNRDCFGDSLLPLPIKLSRATRSLGACTYKKQRRPFGKTVFSDFCIRISTRFDLPENELEDILLHEMIHYEILSKQMHDTSSHGRLFRSRMNEINERFGRNITVSHRMTPQTTPAEARPSWRIVARVRMNDGRSGIKVLPCIARRLKTYRRGLLLSGEVAAVDFFWTDDPYFSRFPKSSALNVFFPGDPDIENHFTTARPIDL